ncbi:mitochondrial DNA-directed RNA polymerase [Perkinsela sp. CCAP 1560/4]|nr:mitochondrial DNA-directed RNA polymerase [Perkinsela sp. CCAP 1560/4]|eukprot:KNH06805.1 mitochondrial DNA-directed RNA polymerase [Perkinsela sp. CCAP 1560/4]
MRASQRYLFHLTEILECSQFLVNREFAHAKKSPIRFKKSGPGRISHNTLRKLFPIVNDDLNELSAAPSNVRSKSDLDFEDRALSTASMKHGSRLRTGHMLSAVNKIARTVLPIHWRWRFVNKNAMAYALLTIFGSRLKLPTKRVDSINTFQRFIDYAVPETHEDVGNSSYYQSSGDLDISALSSKVERDVYEQIDQALNNEHIFDRMESLESMPKWALEDSDETTRGLKLARIGDFLSEVIQSFFDLLGGWTISIPSQDGIPHLLRCVIRHSLKLELHLHTALPSTPKERVIPRKIRNDIHLLIETFSPMLSYPISMIKPVNRRFDVMCYYIAVEVRARMRHKRKAKGPEATVHSSQLAENLPIEKDPATKNSAEIAMRQLIFTGVCEVGTTVHRLGGIREILPALCVLVKMLTFDTLCRIAEDKGRFTKKLLKVKQHFRRNRLLSILQQLRPSKNDVRSVIKKVCPDVFSILSECLRNRSMDLLPMLSKDHLPTHMLYLVTPPSDLVIHYPIQIVPGKWSKTYDSPYRHIKAKIVTKRVFPDMNMNEIDSEGHMKDFLNYIGSIPFRLDVASLHVQEEAIRQGFSFDRTPPAFGLPDQNPHAWTDALHQRSWLKMILANLRHSMDIERFHVPHQMDFRGRIYPLPQMFSIASVRQFRSLLRFEKKFPLGPSGFRWLKIHAANMFGLTKRSFDERVNFIDSNMEIIQRCALSPFNENFHFWGEGDNALEFLAACQEINAAMESGCPETFPSALPVQVDGSANGLQHYSAISRDPLGAAAVNMTASKDPQDVYTHVLTEMKKHIRRDVEAGLTEAVLIHGSGYGANQNHLRRSTIKRAIMTQVYGVTLFGMHQMIENELRAQNQSHGIWSPQEIKYLSKYIQKLLTASLGVVFARTDEARSWLKNTAAMAYNIQSEAHRMPLSFTTPLGFRVVLPYTVQRKRTVYDYNLGVVPVPLSSNIPSRKSITSFSANFIHSLDATHLAMTALEMKKRGLQMTSVHDCYWCHAANMDTLSSIIRETFVELYSTHDPLRRLHKDWSKRYQSELEKNKLFFPQPPSKGNYKLTNVYDAKYFFA